MVIIIVQDKRQIFAEITFLTCEVSLRHRMYFFTIFYIVEHKLKLH